MSRLVTLGSAVAALGAVHAAVNARLVRRPLLNPPPCSSSLAVLLPVRDEASQIEDCLRCVLDQRGVAALRVLVLDDESTDETRATAERIAAEDCRVRVIAGASLPMGWLGKPHACWQLGTLAGPDVDVLVFLDADVRLQLDALAAAVELLQRSGLDLICPYPRQEAHTLTERLVQPLLQWSWLTFLPLRLAERSARPSLSAANGQFLLVRREPYRRAGGHAAVRSEVLDDIGLLRAVKRAGGRGGMVDGSTLASCRMYRTGRELRNGYAKSLWRAFGSTPGAAVTAAGLIICYVVPAVAALRGSRIGVAGYAAGVAGRVVTARASGGPAIPDAAAHPASILALCWLAARSVWLHGRGRLEWKGRAI